jgi:ketosteroid isomerase-like protein
MVNHVTAATNLATLQGAYSRWASTKGGTAAEILDMFDENVEMVSALPADVPDAVAGTHLGRAGAAAYFEGLLRDWEMVDWEVQHYVDGGDMIAVVSRCAWRNKATGNVIDTPKIDVHSFNAAGKVIRFQEAYDTLGFARALGAVPA